MGAGGGESQAGAHDQFDDRMDATNRVAATNSFRGHMEMTQVGAYSTTLSKIVIDKSFKSASNIGFSISFSQQNFTTC